MSTDAARTLTNVRSIRRLHVRFGLGTAAIAFGIALAARLVLAWSRATPAYFPDEYIYAALGRSLSHLHGPAIRGQAAHFPALLQPLLTAPAWRAHSLDTGFRLVQAIESVAFTLAAVPAYLLGRRLSLSRPLAAAVAALALLVPDGVYTGFVLAEPIAYPFALAAAAAAVVAIARPTRRSQIAFLALAALAAAARIQFVVLPLCYLLAAIAVALREHSFKQAVRQQRLVAAALAIVAVGLVASGPSRMLGYYSSVLHPHAHPLVVASALGRNAMILLYAGGWVLVPGAILGLALALARPRTRTELAFGAFATTMIAALLAQASLFGDLDKMQERYVFYVVPLVVLAFGLYASRGWPLLRAHALLGLALLLLAAQVPLAGYAQPGWEDHSPFLMSVQWLELRLGNGQTSLAIAALAGALAVGSGVLARFRPRGATVAVLAVAVLICAASTAGVWTFERDNTRNVAHRFLPRDPSWIDAAGVGPVTLVTAYNGLSSDAELQLWWNRSVDRVAVLGGGTAPDRFAASPILVAADGTLEVAHRPIAGALALDGYGGTLVMRSARRIASSEDFALWQPHGRPRLALYFAGRYWDGRLATKGALIVWPRRLAAGLHGWLELTLRGPDTGTLKLHLRHSGSQTSYRVPAGRSLNVRLPICSDGPWSTDFQAEGEERIDQRVVAGSTSVPRFVPDASACAAPHAGRSS